MKKKIAVVLGKGCNYRCFYCFEKVGENAFDAHRKMTEATAARVIEYIERERLKLKDGEFISLNLYGGEPLLYPDRAEQFIEYAKGKNIDVRFITNGSLIMKLQDRILRWKEMIGQHLEFLVSYDYALQEKNRCGGSYQKVRDGMLWLDANEIDFATNTIFMMEDFPMMQACFQDFLKLKRQLVHNKKIRFRIGLDKIGCRGEIDYEAAEASLKHFSDILREHPSLSSHITYRFGKLQGSYRKKSCGLGWRMLWGVDYDGTFYTCIGGIFHPRRDELTFGSVYDDPVEVEAKRAAVMEKVVKPLPEKCKSCNNFCRVCSIDVFDRDGIIEDNHCRIHGIVTRAIKPI